MRIIRHDLSAPEQTTLTLMRTLAVLVGWIALPVGVTVAMWREWVPNELGIPLCLLSPIAPFLWIHLYRRMLLLDRAEAIDAGVTTTRAAECPPGLWRHVARAAGLPGDHGWIGGTSESAAGRFAESVLSGLGDDPRSTERAHAVEWRDECAVLLWHRPMLEGSHPQECMYALWVWDGGRGAGDLAARITTALSELDGDPERARSLVESAGRPVDRRFSAVMFHPSVLVIGGSPRLRPALLHLKAEMVMHYEHPRTLWVGSMAMGTQTPDPPGRVTAAIEAALLAPRTATA